MRESHSHRSFRLGVIKAHVLAIVILIPAMAMAACQGRTTITSTPIPHNITGPVFNHITTSSKSFSIECVPTSVTVTADVTDPSGIKRVILFYRVDTNQPYTGVDMNPAAGGYSVAIKGVDVPGKHYGVWEFYITAEDLAGNQSQSALDRSVELLLCVSS